MKAFNRIALTVGATATALSLALTFYNSAALNNDSFMSAKLNLNNKRLDELNGEVVIGRMAASTRSWDSLEDKKEVKKVTKIKKEVAKTTTKEEIDPLAPAIQEDLELTLASVKLGSNRKGKAKKLNELKEGTFTGSARTSNGYVEEVVVNLPDGRRIDIYSHKQMASNVFEYVDQETGEVKSAMMYESAKNTFTVMLTNDAHYPGTKLEFKTDGSGLGNLGNSDDLNWGMNDQNINSEYANDNNAYEETYQEQEPVDYAQEENVEPAQSFSFGFNS